MIKGHCLCGAVEWTAIATPRAVHHCHCSMCRRWTGAAFATLVWFNLQNDVVWAGTPTVWRSSPIARRSHCSRCGTPLALTYDGRSDIALAAGSLEDPSTLEPSSHYGTESRLPWTDGLGQGLPQNETREHLS